MKPLSSFLFLLSLCLHNIAYCTWSFSGMQSVPSCSVPLTKDYTLVGRSRAGDGTTFVIPELRWMFDCGALVDGGGLKQPRIIFLTHMHSDHIFTLAHFTVHKGQDAKGMEVYLPEKAVPFVQNYLKAYEELVEMKEKDDESSPFLFKLIGVKPNQEIKIRQGGKEFRVRVVECVHRIDCVGYSIFQQEKKLKDEYKGLEGKEIGRLRKEGVEINDRSWNPLACYLGDTTAGVFQNHPEILEEHSTIVVECSFLESDTKPQADKTLHMHWDDLQPIVESHPNIKFLLTHFSLRYSALQILEFFNNNQSTTNKNLHPMLVPEEIHKEENARNNKKTASS